MIHEAYNFYRLYSSLKQRPIFLYSFIFYIIFYKYTHTYEAEYIFGHIRFPYMEKYLRTVRFRAFEYYLEWSESGEDSKVCATMTFTSEWISQKLNGAEWPFNMTWLEELWAIFGDRIHSASKYHRRANQHFYKEFGFFYLTS